VFDEAQLIERCGSLVEHSGSAGPDGVPRLAEGLAAGALPARVTHGYLWYP